MREYWLKPGRETLHGVLSAELAPALTVDSGDLVNIETLEADWRVSRPDSACGGAEFFPRRPGLDDGQALCGPIYVRGLMPGMALQIEIGAIETAGWGWSSVGIGDADHLRRLGYAGKEYFQVWDIADGLCTSPGGLRVPVSPFPGILAVAPRCGRANTHIPAEHGGNLDCRLLGPGAVLCLPAFHEGGLFSVGDGHAAQGDGESGGTAVECPFKNIRLRLSARPGLIESPVAKTVDGMVTFGFSRDLTAAAYEALQRMYELMQRYFPLTREDCITLCSVCADLRVTQLVNGVRGVHAVFPHSVWESLQEKFAGSALSAGI